MAKMAESVLDLDQQIEELSRLKDEKVRAAAAKRKADHEKLLRDPAERRRRVKLLTDRDEEIARLDRAIKEIEDEEKGRTPEALLARLRQGSVAEQLARLQEYLLFPSETRKPPLRRKRDNLVGARKDRHTDSLQQSLLQCCPTVREFLDDLDRAVNDCILSHHAPNWTDQSERSLTARQESLARLKGELARNWSRWVELEEAPGAVDALRRQYDLDPAPAALPSNAPVSEHIEAMSRENTSALVRR
jgi:hypothetical protein